MNEQNLFAVSGACYGLYHDGHNCFAQTADTLAPQAQAELSTGEVISFGSYPQTEVTGTALTDAIVNASYDGNGDAEVGGERYRRIKVAGYVIKEEF